MKYKVYYHIRCIITPAIWFEFEFSTAVPAVVVVPTNENKSAVSPSGATEFENEKKERERARQRIRNIWFDFIVAAIWKKYYNVTWLCVHF